MPAISNNLGRQGLVGNSFMREQRSFSTPATRTQPVDPNKYVNPLFDFKNKPDPAAGFFKKAFTRNPQTGEGGLTTMIRSAFVPTANAQTAVPQTQTQSPVKIETKQQAPVVSQPTPQSSYQGGQTVPTVGSPEYEQARKMASGGLSATQTGQSQGTSPTTSTVQNTGVPGLFQQALAAQQQIGKGESPDITRAREEVAKLRQNLAQTNLDIATNPNMSLETKTAIQGQTQAAGAEKVKALEANLANALTAQGQRITALGGVTSATAPVSVPFSTQFVSPETGSPISGGSAASPFQGGVNLGNLAAGQNYANMKIADSAARNIKGLITGYLEQNPSLNPSSLTAGNTLTQWLAGQQLGDPKYQTLFNYLNEYISTLAPILGVGGDTTNLKTQIAQSFINAKASGQSISEVLNNIENLAVSKLSAIESAGMGGAPTQSTQTGTPMFGSFF